VQYRDGHISTCFNKDTCDICIYCAYVLVPVNYSLSLLVIYLIVLVDSLFIVHLFFSLFDHYFVCCLFSFLINSLFYLLFKKEKNNSDPELVFRYSDPANHHQYEPINIIQ
jgi:hypothetical protein